MKHIITDEDGRFWTGIGWSDMEEDALIFDSYDNASDTRDRIEDDQQELTVSEY